MFYTAGIEEIKSGKLTDVYFLRCVEVLKKRGLDKHVTGEVRASRLPASWNWAVLSGIEEVAALLENVKVDVKCMPEGTVFEAEEPVLTLSGNYTDFAVYETALLGLLCQASGVSTKALRCRIAAGDRDVYSFGARRMHPIIAPMIERAAFIGGMDGVAVTTSAELIGEKPVGTMPHSLILMMGRPEDAYKAFDEVISDEIGRVALVDTFEDEKFGALTAAKALGKRLFAVRLDTPGSRRGDFSKIVEEVRWELDLRGFKDVRIFLSGGLDEYKILEYNRFVDAYGVGTSISNAPVIDFSFDLIEISGEPVAKRGKMSGKKQVVRCSGCGKDYLIPTDTADMECGCGGPVDLLLKDMITDGKVVGDLRTPQDIRSYVVDHARQMDLEL